MAAAAPIKEFLEVVRLGEEREWRDLLLFVLYWETIEYVTLSDISRTRSTEITLTRKRLKIGACE
jgi:hypothetical protein